MKRGGRWFILLAVLTGLFAGCSNVKEGNASVIQGQTSQESSQGASQESGQETGQETQMQEQNSQENPVPVVENGKITLGDLVVSLDADDVYTSWDEGAAVRIELDDQGITINGQGAKAEKSTVTITDAGTYYVKGTLSDGTILVDAGDTDIVRLIFDGVDIHSETSAAVDIRQAKKAIISLEDGSINSLSDSVNLKFWDEEKEEPNAALFCKGDLTINGSGTLTVNGSFKHGICVKDTLKIAGGTFDVSAADHGIKGNDALVVYDGQFAVNAVGDGLKSDTLAAVLGGDIRISNCEEGLEAETVVVYGGSIDLTANDDGINASTDGNAVPKLYFMGGTVMIHAEGDGIDSNGSIEMSGGQVTVYGPSQRDDGALDYDREFILTGGVLAAFGPGGMEQNVSTADSQVSVLADFQESQRAGTTVILKDSEGNVLYQGTGEKAFQTVVLSVPEMTVGNAYTIEAGETVISFTPEETIVYVNKEGIQEASMQPGHGGPGNRGGRMNKEPEDGDRLGSPEGREGGRRGEEPEEWNDEERPEPPKGQEGGRRGKAPEEWEDGERPEPPKDWDDSERPKPPEGQNDMKPPESSES